MSAVAAVLGVRTFGVWKLLQMICCVFFFFSSRRRHTRLQGDWSSDVCTSDLDYVAGKEIDTSQHYLASVRIQSDSHGGLYWDAQWMHTDRGLKGGWFIVRVQMRSEERRVGKECRSRWSPYH